jgi:uncharacterized protein YbjQ (UPF0145 family)
MDCHTTGRTNPYGEKQNIEIEAILLTTKTAPNLNITKRIEVITAECAFGMNIFKDLFAVIRDIVGGRSEAIQSTIRDSRRTALFELKKEAHLVGANAVVGVDCPMDIIDQIGGWKFVSSIGENYGRGYSIKLIGKWVGSFSLAVTL